MKIIDKPLAAAGLTSYRYPSPYGWVMIGASDNADALREAARSIGTKPTIDRLEIWNGTAYVAVAGTRSAK